MSRYPDVPGFVAESETSAAAAKAIEEFSPSQASWCEAWFKDQTERVKKLRTCEQCEMAAKAAGKAGRHQSISARIRSDLFLKRRCLWKVGTDKITGKLVKVWEQTDTSNLVTNEAGVIVYRKGRNSTGRSAVLYGWGYA